jgi:hypothetical protein
MERPSVPNSVDELNATTISGAAEEYPPAQRHVKKFKKLAKHVIHHFFHTCYVRGYLASILIKWDFNNAYRPIAWICRIVEAPGKINGRCIVREPFYSCYCFLLVHQHSAIATLFDPGRAFVTGTIEIARS